MAPAWVPQAVCFLAAVYRGFKRADQQRAAGRLQVGSTQLMDATDGNHPKHTLIQGNIIREVMACRA